MCSSVIFLGCNDKQDSANERVEAQQNVINAELITPNLTRSEIDKDFYTEGYLCTSATSSLKSEIYVDATNQETISYVIGKNGEVAQILKIQVDSYMSDKVCAFTVYDEFDEPIMSGVFDTVNQYSQITNVYGDNVVSRASVAAWGCNISLGLVGAMWSTAFGMVSAGAGFVVGMSYTVMAMAVCGDL